MKQYALVAYDYKDGGALERRMVCRQSHLDGLRRLARQGRFISGGVILDDHGKMIGSNAHFQFPDRRELEAWLEVEPYMTGQVWEQVEISEVKLFDPSS
ncbi:YciI family protein [Halomonas elongata]|uniref:YciI family protein n=1 Tax=Halomonas elongata TaxID=2746 RepID=UPI0023B0C29A|nr:YciI family protein [Halomonas elongata]